MPARAALRLLRRHQWLLVGVVALVALELGYLGMGALQQHSAGTTKLPLSPLDRLYYAVLLFKMTGPFTPPFPWQLEVAEWLAPATLVYTALAAAAAIFARQWAELRTRRWRRGHVVVCGLGDAGARLASAFRDRGAEVVAVERDGGGEDGGAGQQWQERGVHVVSGDATDEAVLLRAGVARAAYVVVVCGDDETNADVALAVPRALARSRGGRGRRGPARGGRSLRCFVQVSDDRLCRLLEEAVLARPGRAEVRLEFFNVVRSGLKALLDDYGSDLVEKGAPPHFVVVGEGRLARHLVAELARRWWLGQGAGAPRCHATLVAADADAGVAALEQRLPALSAACELTSCQAEPSDPDSPAISIELRAPASRSVCFVCSDNDDSAAVRAAIVARRSLPDPVTVVLCTRGRSAVPGLLGGAGKSGLANMATFGLLDRVCTPEVLLNGVPEELAQSIHADYVRRRRQQMAEVPAAGHPGAPSADDILPPDDPALRSWQALPEALRESNRDQAGDIGRKLGLVGCHLEPLTSWGSAPHEFSPPELELLARAEHDRWCQERTRQGWQYGPVRDAEARYNPDLVPWEQLTERSKDLDRDAVRAIPLFLARLGYAIVPGTAGLPGANGATMAQASPSAGGPVPARGPT